MCRSRDSLPRRPVASWSLTGARRATVNRFKAARAPGEGYSAAILRLAKQEVVTA
jgi:hypothetical protein